MKRLLLGLLLLAGSIGTCLGHDTWANGKYLPPWLKQFCCSIADVHRYTVGQLQHDSFGWYVPELARAIPDAEVRASEDEFAWAFFTDPAGQNESPRVWCFFLPQGGV